MCSRYAATAAPKAVAARFGVSAAPGQKPRCNLAAGETAPVVIAAPAPRLTLLRWGLAPAWASGPNAKPQINARAESLADKPFFRDAFRWRRALVPADGWFELPKRGADKAPRLFRLRDGGLFAFAGIWEPSGFAIATVAPNPLVARIHDRMPAVLTRADESAWLDPRAKPDALLALLRPFPSELLEAVRVGARVFAGACDDPALLAPVPAPQPELF